MSKNPNIFAAEVDGSRIRKEIVADSKTILSGYVWMGLEFIAENIHVDPRAT